MKKILSSLIVLILLFNIIIPVNATEGVYYDVEGTRYEEAITVLEQLGMIESFFEDSFDVQSKVSRGDFAIIFAKVLGDKGDRKIANKFIDIQADTELAAAVNYLEEIGIINGVAPGVYNPDAPMTLDMVYKCIVYALGYKNLEGVIESREIANELRINRGISASHTDGVTR